MPPGNRAIPQPCPPRKPCLQRTWNGSDDPLWRYGHSIFDIMMGAFGTPIFQGRGDHRGSSIRRALLVSYTLPIVIITPSLTIQPQFAIECLRRSIRQGEWVGGWVGNFGPKFWVFPLEYMLGFAEIANTPGYTNREIISRPSVVCRLSVCDVMYCG